MRVSDLEELLLQKEEGCEKSRSQHAGVSELAIYARLRCIPTVLMAGWRLYGGSGGIKTGDALLLPAATLTLATPNLLLVFWLLLQSIALNAVRMPWVWDMDYWASLLDLAFLLSAAATLFDRRGSWRSSSALELENAVVRDAGPSVCAMFEILMFGAGFWKLNSSFFDKDSSCVTILFMQLVASFVPPALMPPWLPWLVRAASPVAGATLECTFPLLLVFPGWPRRLGLLAGVVFSIGIAYMPPPNDAGLFPLHYMAGSFFFFLPAATTAAWSQCTIIFQLCPVLAQSKMFSAALFAGLALAIPCLQISELLVGPAVLLISLGVVWAVFLDARGLAAAGSSDRDSCQISKKSSAGLVSFVLVIILAIFVSFIGILFGLFNCSNEAMYASLRGFTGSNHFLLPTGLLLEWFADPALANAWPLAGEVFGGGVVRIDYTNSSLINQAYPAEVTSVLDDRTMALLDDVGFKVREFGFEIGVALGASLLPTSTQLADFVKYMVPALELRRMLALARDAGEVFMLKYTRPPRGAYPDESWFKEPHPSNSVQVTGLCLLRCR